MEDSDIPLDIVRHILSYRPYPVHRKVSSMFNTAENELDNERIDRMRRRYTSISDAVQSRDWNAIIFMMNRPGIFPISKTQADTIIRIAIQDKKNNIAMMMLDKGYSDYNDIAKYSIMNKNPDILEYILDNYTVSNINDLADIAVDNDDLSMTIILARAGADLYSIASEAILSDSNRILNWVIQRYGDKIADEAIRSNDRDMLDVIREVDPSILSEIYQRSKKVKLL